MMTAAMATMATVEAARITHPSLPGDLLVKTYAEAYAHCAVDHQWFVTAISPAIPAA
jgi:hypothetical protein